MKVHKLSKKKSKKLNCSFKTLLINSTRTRQINKIKCITWIRNSLNNHKGIIIIRITIRINIMTNTILIIIKIIIIRILISHITSNQATLTVLITMNLTKTTKVIKNHNTIIDKLNKTIDSRFRKKVKRI